MSDEGQFHVQLAGVFALSSEVFRLLPSSYGSDEGQFQVESACVPSFTFLLCE